MKHIFILFFSCLGFLSQAQKMEIKLKNQESINTPFNEFSPIAWGDYFIYVSFGKEEKSKKYFDLKFSAANLDNQMMRSAFLPSDINTDFHEGPASFDATTETLYFTRSHSDGSTLKADVSQKVQLKIYKSTYSDGQWSRPEKINLNKDGYSYCHPSISPSGKTMLFASDENSQDGKLDLWQAKAIDGEWTDAVKLDSTINRIGNQWFPFLYSDEIFFFASINENTSQGLDLSIGTLDESHKTKTLPYPINSNFDDFGIWINPSGEKGFFSSNRSGGKGGDDIYSFEMEDDLVGFLLAQANAMNVKGKEQVTLSEIKEDPMIRKETVVNKNPIVKHQDNKAVEVSMPPKNVNSNILTGIGQITVFDKIYFDRESNNIRPEATTELDELFELMLAYPNLKVQLSAHTDSRGSESYNQTLSDQRAETAKRYLVTRGILTSRIIPLGFGESRLKNHCADNVICNEDQHRQNRRLEIKVIDN